MNARAPGRRTPGGALKYSSVLANTRHVRATLLSQLLRGHCENFAKISWNAGTSGMWAAQSTV